MGAKINNIQVIRSVAEMSSFCRGLRSRNTRLGLVPTMGYLHAGHLSLLHLLKGGCDIMTASIFVNPIQFGEGEDIDRYPRDEEKDLKLLSEAGCELVFSPDAEEMYPPDFQTYIDVEKVSQPLCGQYRPGHFRGVATVVNRLFNITGCSVAAFGLKDYQQAKVIERMVRDLNLQVGLVFGETVREADGLAMSSRNAYLTEDERELAQLIPKSLEWCRKQAADGEEDCATLLSGAHEILVVKTGIRVQYLEAVDSETLKPRAEVGDSVQILIAAFVGNTRLIDNINVGPRSGSKPIKGVNV